MAVTGRFAEDLLHGDWVRSREEDADAELVFRRPAYPFPPARGRDELRLDPDRTYVERAPGPVDVPEESTGRWSLADDRLTLRPDASGAAAHGWTIAAAEPDRLVVREEG